KGILFKGGAYLENFGLIKAIAFDKTGTLTSGKLVMTDAFFKAGEDEKKIQMVCTALEKMSTHPIAKAIVLAFEDQGHPSFMMEDVNDLTGYGLSGTAFGSQWKIGKKEYVVKSTETATFSTDAEKIQKEGKTVIYVSRNDQLVAYFGLQDIPKKEAKEM